MNMEKVVVIIGPTAVGKTKLSIEVAKRFNGEIISGDSMQIYRSMDIGTAKITPEEMEGIPHHLIDIKDPTEPYSTAEFQTDVRKLIQEITARGKLPIIVGGTGLYIQSVIHNYHFSEKGSDEAVRKQLETELAEKGIDVLMERLQQIDPISAESIHPNNHRRVIRALEVYITTGKTMSDYMDEQEEELLYDLALIGLTLDREILYHRINQRVDLMVEEGLEEEVRKLHDLGIKDVQSIQAIGYKELYQYLDGLISFQDAIELLKRNSRRYAKRQLTWFRNKMDVKWFDMTEGDYEKKFIEIIEYIAGKLKI
ncbi:tRNA dimethylallyltransferase [Bacillus mesophilus]|uniref:tRNA dimethylallyltransferase n=1 Tax=Bacillus mesophilus TaxID=1808955 RepID=A0A6M0Q317_9BACI|nr:tRNA (adenosine(37)-N6)-dimethylallyltransferase MiaA [Bacillus mesophilus]MBM7659275.1 tRNA dimethylallyltransferase [Bacillus mesophilus]NEY70149.1 tRNA (adenosine(37)-N6)-dimethylallyltransferase MiaA [Bacillus mesophilus]